MELLTLSTGCDMYIHFCNFVFVHRLMNVESHNRVQKYSEILWSRNCIAPEKFWSILFKFLLNNGKTVLFIYLKCPQQVYPLWWLYQRHGETDRVYLVNERSRVQTPLSSLFVFTEWPLPVTVFCLNGVWQLILLIKLSWQTVVNFHRLIFQYSIFFSHYW